MAPEDGDAGKAPDDWGLSQERQMIEKIINHRFNFFMLVFTVVLTSSVTAQSRLHLKLILGAGLVICLLFAWSLWWNQKELNVILGLLYKDPNHPLTILRNIIRRPLPRGVVGYVVPAVCIFFLAGVNILVWLYPAG